MKCRQAKERISQYIDDELSADERRAFELHIRDCAACREELEETRAVHRMFVSAENFSAPYGFATRVLANLEAEEPTWFRRLSGLGSCFFRSAEVAVALAIMTIGIISGNLLLEQKMPVNTQTALQDSFSLNLFRATPPDSIGGIYLAYMGGDR